MLELSDPSPCQMDLVPIELLLTSQNLEAVEMSFKLDEKTYPCMKLATANRDRYTYLVFATRAIKLI